MYLQLFLTIGFFAISTALADSKHAFKVTENEDIPKCKYSIFNVDLIQEQSLDTPWVSSTSMLFYKIQVSNSANMRGTANDDVVGVGFKSEPGSISTDRWCLPPGIYTLSLGIDTAHLMTSLKACQNNVLVKPGESKIVKFDESGICKELQLTSVYGKPRESNFNFFSYNSPVSAHRNEESFSFTFAGGSRNNGYSGMHYSGMSSSHVSYDLTYKHCFPEFSMQNSAPAHGQPTRSPTKIPTTSPTRRPTPSPTKAGDVAIQVSVGVSLAGVASIDDAKKLGPSLIKAMETSLNLTTGSVSIAGYEEITSNRRQLQGFPFSLFKRSLAVTGVTVNFKLMFYASQVMSSSSGYSVSGAVDAMNTKIQSVVSGSGTSSVFLQTLKATVSSDPSLSTLVNQIQGVAATEVVNTSPTAAPTSAPGDGKAKADGSIAVIAGAAGGGGGAVLIGVVVYLMRRQGLKQVVTKPETHLRSVAPL